MKDEWHKTMIKALESERLFIKSNESIYPLLAVSISVLLVMLMYNLNQDPIDKAALLMNFLFFLFSTVVFILLIWSIEKKEKRIIKRIRKQYMILLGRKK